MALAVEECVTLDRTLSAMDLLCFGGFRSQADDPPKPPPAQKLVRGTSWRRWVWFLGTTSLPVGLYFHLFQSILSIDGLVKSPEIVTPAKAGVYNHLK